MAQYICIFTALRVIPQKRFDLKMLLQPFEKQLYFPSFLIQEGNLSSVQVHVIGQENKFQVMLGVIILNSSQLFRILASGFGYQQSANLIIDDTCCFIYGLGIHPLELEVILSPYHKE